MKKINEKNKATFRKYFGDILKILFSLCITILAYTTIHSKRYLLVSVIELFMIILLSHIIMNYKEAIGRFIGFFLLLVYNIQTLIMYFSGSYTKLIMITNITLINDLHGKFTLYLRLIVPLLLCTMIPTKKIVIKRKEIAIAMLFMLGCAIAVIGMEYSPMYNVYDLYTNWRNYKKMVSEVGNTSSNADLFYKAEVSDYAIKPPNIPEQPNIVLIFMEGVSESIVEDDRQIMPNADKLRENSLVFNNYYNHTFATLRGLIGQLYSGYQLENLDTNPFASMQSILREEGYQTTFINTEPTNEEFTNYLMSFDFDELVTDDTKVDRKAAYIHDKDAFELLYNTMEEQNKKATPFFTTIYTFGTHMSLDSPDEKFKDGKVAMLNKFYNADYQLGCFVEKFRSSELFDNTILIFTTDHATYVDDDYLECFSNYKRLYSSVDRIPLYIYYKGVSPEEIDANGCNSLDLVPTILDYLDITNSNYFLGKSLFAKTSQEMDFDTIFDYPSLTLSTFHNTIGKLTQNQYKSFVSSEMKYFAAKGNYGSELLNTDFLIASISDSGDMLVELTTENRYANVWFPVWSLKNGQDDLIWYKAIKKESGSWQASINLKEHNNESGEYFIEAYAGDKEPKRKVTSTSISIGNQ